MKNLLVKWLPLLLLGACALRPSAVSESADMIMVKSVRIPDRSWLPWYTRWAEHTWIDFKRQGDWFRTEWNAHGEVGLYELADGVPFSDTRWERDVMVVRVVRGDGAQQLAERIAATAGTYPCDGHYRAWPGPNSNSYVEWLARQVGLGVVLPATAIGKDFVTWLHVGATTSGTGIECETLPVGVQVGLLEGVEVHVIGLSVGVRLWPPAITLPFVASISGDWFAP